MANLVFVKLPVPLYRSGNPQAAVGLSNRSINFRNMEVIALTTEIGMEAARLRADHGLRTPDAIHGATHLSATSLTDSGLAQSAGHVLQVCFHAQMSPRGDN
jgi:hypothetical protein